MNLISRPAPSAPATYFGYFVRESEPPAGRRGTVLVVDDEVVNLGFLERLLGAEGYVIHTASTGETGLEMLELCQPDIILLDVKLPGADGFEICRQVKRRGGNRLTPVILMTAMHDRENRLEGIRAGADGFLAKPFDTEELRARVHSLVQLKRYTDDLDSAESVILSLAMTVEARDPYTQGHCERLAAYATALGRTLNLPDEEIAALHRGGYLHDVGKIAVPDAILQKSDGLTGAEQELMRQHTVVGERLCGDLRSLRLVRPIVRQHHERLDGTGYPDGLVGDQISLLAQIVSIADIYDAITTSRPYRPAAPAEVAHGELRAEASTGGLNHELVEAFIDLGRTGVLARSAACFLRAVAVPRVG